MNMQILHFKTSLEIKKKKQEVNVFKLIKEGKRNQRTDQRSRVYLYRRLKTLCLVFLGCLWSRPPWPRPLFP